jgi:hypothetical protein
MKKRFFAFLLMIMGLQIIACSRQWREGDFKVNSKQVLGGLNQTFSLSADSATAQFQSIYNSGSASLFYCEAVAGQKTPFGNGIERVFPISSWAVLGFSAASNTIKAVKAYFVENAEQGQYALLIDMTTTSGREVKSFIAQAVQSSGNELILNMGDGFTLRTFDTADGEGLADNLQFEIYDNQGEFAGKISAMTSL